MRGQHGSRTATEPKLDLWHWYGTLLPRQLSLGVSDWLEKYLRLGHDFQQAAPTQYMYKFNNYMFGAQLDKAGNGMHYQLMTKIRTNWTAEDANAWTDKLEYDFMPHFLDLDITEEEHTSSCRCTMAKEKYQDQHAVYACHAHKNPWTVRQRGTFPAKNPREYFELFLKWQDHEHRKLHIYNVEKDVENLRSGGGEHVVPDEVELAARDLEDLIAEGQVARTKNGINLTFPELCRVFYSAKKRAGVTFPKMTRAKKEVVVCLACSRTHVLLSCFV